MKYFEKLRDPRWQKKRLEVFKRDKFTCQICMDKESTLAVHHKKYVSGKEPWDYKNEFLITLCEKCHEKLKDKIPYKGDIRYAFVMDRDKIIDRNGDRGVVIDLTTCEMLYDLFLCGQNAREAFYYLLREFCFDYDLNGKEEMDRAKRDIKNFILDLESAKKLIYDSQDVRNAVKKQIKKHMILIENFFNSNGRTDALRKN